MSDPVKKYPGPKSIAKRLKPLAEWMRANKPACKVMTVTRDDMVGLLKAKPAVLTSNGFHRTGDAIGYAEFAIHEPPKLEPLPYLQHGVTP
jgi:hypothetical protein